MVLSQPPQKNDAVQRVCDDRLFDLHAQEIAEQHRRGAHVVLPQRHDGKLQREAARLPDAALDSLGELPQVGVAVGQLAPRVADADDGLALVRWLAVALGLERRFAQPSVKLGRVQPLSTAIRLSVSGHFFRSPSVKFLGRSNIIQGSKENRKKGGRTEEIAYCREPG